MWTLIRHTSGKQSPFAQLHACGPCLLGLNTEAQPLEFECMKRLELRGGALSKVLPRLFLACWHEPSALRNGGRFMDVRSCQDSHAGGTNSSLLALIRGH